MISVKVDNSKINIYLDKLTPQIMNAIEKEIVVQSQGLVDFMKVNYLRGGPSESKLAVRTGLLWKTASTIPATKSEDRIIGGMSVGDGVPYAKVHVNDYGKITTITAKGKMLTIPLGPARTAGGASRRANAMAWGTGKGGLFPWKSKTSGRSFLVKAEGKKIIPYFALVRSVKVRARVDPSMVLKVRQRKIVAGIESAIKAAIK
jgi:hypothetical protein